MTFKKKFNFNKFLFFFVLIFLLCFPHGSSYYFNGIPFNNKFETIYILIFLPLFLILTWKDIFKKNYISIYFFLVILKIILILSPNNGINIYQYLDKDNFKKNNIIKTYNTFWNKEKSYVQKNEWLEKNDFPIDWKENGGNKFRDIQYKYKIRTINDFENISLIYKIDFFLKPNEKSVFILKSKGCSFGELEFKIINEKNLLKKIKCNEQIALENKLYYVNGVLELKGKNWSLEPLIKEKNDKFKSAFKNNNIFIENHFILKKDYYKFINFISFVFTFSIIFLPIIFLFILLKNNLIIKKYLIYSVTFFFIYLLINSFLYEYLNFKNFDTHGATKISITLVISIILYFLISNKLKFKEINIQNLRLIYFIIFAPTILFFFYKSNIHIIDKISSFGWNDDWHFFEFFARSMVVNNQWLLAGEEIIFFRLAPRYVFAISHIVFGKSLFFIKFIEPWLIIFSAYSLTLLAHKIKLTKNFSILSGITLLIFFFGENYRWLIGRGLSEFYALFIISLSIQVCINTKFSYKQIFILFLISTIGVSFREEHLLLYLSLIFLNLLSINNLRYKQKNFFVIFYSFFINNYKKIFFYWILVTFGFSLLFIRNYYLSGEFALFVHKNLMNENLNYLVNFSRMLLGNNPEISFIPQSTSIFLLSGLLISVLCLFNKNIQYLNYQIFLPIIVIAILFPYLFVTNWAYPPRFTIHYLPFCIIILYSVIQNYFLKKFRYSRKISNLLNS